ncbi:type VII secretion target [Mycobacteroides abscessus]|uniref:type VII secretion target n=2 Tax=Mycobacteroides abscessus TaxID=36809 RepID=UPI001F1A2F48|nr:type VII secretion target [Mycobacteroides abscessus]
MADGRIAPHWCTGQRGPVENAYGLLDYYHMSSERISVDPESLRVAADGNADAASVLDEYGRACKAWMDEVEEEIIRCHGLVSAPVGAALRDFFGGVVDQVSAAGGAHAGMNENLSAAADRYDEADASGAARVSASGGVV